MPTDKRRKDANWDIYGDAQWEGVWKDSYYQAMQLSVLMDLRDELKRLNTLLHCGNFVRIPFVLDGIAKNTKRPKRKRKAK